MDINVRKIVNDIELNFDGKFYNRVIEDGIKFIRQYKNVDISYICIINMVALSYMKIGKIEEAFKTFKIVLDIPNCYSPEVYSNFLLNMNYLGTLTKEQKYQYSKEYEAYITTKGNIKINSLSMNKANLDYSSRIRIGYISSDFRGHPVMNFITPILRSHDKSSFEIYCYYDFDSSDNTTDFIKGLTENWRTVYEKSNNDLKQCIQDDKIDILIDLTGHTEGGRRLPLFAQRLAPIQVTYLGYPNTSGLKNMDYRITDIYADTEDSQGYYSEKLIRKEKCFLCYRYNDELPDIKLNVFCEFEKKHIVFGSFNNYSKITEKCIRMWSDILIKTSNSRLYLKSLAFYDKGSAKNIYSRFEKYGIDSNRIVIIQPTNSIKEHLDKYNEIDIALDAYPYNGTTTTCEAMIMGVPVITLSGEEHLSRVGKSLLSNIGLSELIACSEEEYIQKTIELASDRERLYGIKKDLRNKMINSDLMDKEGFTAEFEKILKGFWNIRAYKTIYNENKEDKVIIEDIEEKINKGVELYYTLNEGCTHVINCLEIGRNDKETGEIMKIIYEVCFSYKNNFKFLAYRNKVLDQILNEDLIKVVNLLKRVFEIKDYESTIKVINEPLKKLMDLLVTNLLIEKDCIEYIGRGLLKTEF